MRVILASGSPRRRELLKMIYDEFEVITSDVDESIDMTDPSEIVESLSGRKAKAVYDGVMSTDSAKTTSESASGSRDDIIVIGADTIVFYDGEVLGKPADPEEAKAMISMLSDRTHQVYTGVSIYAVKNGKESVISFSDVTDVSFYYIDKYDIADYVNSGSPLDKAGAYGIQDDFAKHVKGINGDYNNVVGLPVAKLYQTLKDSRLL